MFLIGYLWHIIQTTKHKFYVLKNIIMLNYKLNHEYKTKLLIRGIFHDFSKYRWSEAKNFANVIFKLRETTYGSEEYRKLLNEIKPSIDLHYIRNYHHPEHYKNGYLDMVEIDKLEMICDWLSSCKRHKDGDIFKSIDINQKRFGYSEDDRISLITIANLLA